MYLHGSSEFPPSDEKIKLMDAIFETGKTSNFKMLICLSCYLLNNK